MNWPEAIVLVSANIAFAALGAVFMITGRLGK